MLRMYLEIRYELINLGHQINQHNGIAWEITVIIQMAENRSTPWIFLLFPPRLSTRWPKSSVEQIPHSSHQSHKSSIPFLFPAIVNFFYLHVYTPCTILASTKWRDAMSCFPFLAFGRRDLPHNSEAITSGHLKVFYFYFIYYSPFSHIPYSNQVHGNTNVFMFLNVTLNSAFFSLAENTFRNTLSAC